MSDMRLEGDAIQFDDISQTMSKKIAEALNVSPELLASDIASHARPFQTMYDAWMEKVRARRDQMIDYVLYSAHQIIDYRMSRTGKAVLVRQLMHNGQHPVVDGLRSEIPVRLRAVGPHRPRRLAHRVLRAQIGTIRSNVSWFPIKPVNNVEIKFVVGELNGTQGAVAQEAEQG